MVGDSSIDVSTAQPFIVTAAFTCVLLAFFQPDLFDQLRGVLQLTAMHWGRLSWTRDTQASVLDGGDADDVDDETDDRVLGTGSHLANAKQTPGHIFPGLDNASGNTCFLNAAVQSMASVDSLVPYLAHVVRSAVQQHDEAPVATRFLELVLELNKPSTSRRVLRPDALARALFNSSESRQHIMNAEQQDAHEFYVMLTEAINDELVKLEKSSTKASEAASFGLQTISNVPAPDDVSHCRDPFESLMARRVSCVACRYTENVVHYHEEHLTLNLPPVRSCTLSEMLDDFVKLDLIDERVCSKCSITMTIERLRDELEHLDATLPKAKKRQRQLSELQEALGSGRFDDVDPSAVDRAERPATKQAMFARPPPALAIHLVRSSVYRSGIAVKNSCRVSAPAELDLSPYVTGATLNVRPEASMGDLRRKRSVDLDTSRKPPESLRYRLSSVVEHFGSHGAGHYVAYATRRARWYRISDESVYISRVEEALNANPYLLFYERIEQIDPISQGPTVQTSPSKQVPRLVQRLSALQHAPDRAERTERARSVDEEPTAAL